MHYATEIVDNYIYDKGLGRRRAYGSNLLLRKEKSLLVLLVEYIGCDLILNIPCIVGGAHKKLLSQVEQAVQIQLDDAQRKITLTQEASIRYIRCSYYKR